jgi:diguanylate cyclase (GGDEF)-like protein
MALPSDHIESTPSNGLETKSHVLFFLRRRRARELRVLREENRLLRAENDRLKTHVNIDPQTGALSREGLDDVFRRNELASGNPSDRYAWVFIDVDRIKNVNDQHGHDAGDVLLNSLVKRLQALKIFTLDIEVVRNNKKGDEFALLIRDQRADETNGRRIGKDRRVSTAEFEGEDRRVHSRRSPSRDLERRSDPNRSNGEVFERFVRRAVRNALEEAKREAVQLVSADGREVEVLLDYSYGFGFFQGYDPDVRIDASKRADDEMYLHKSGLFDLIEAEKSMDPDARDFLINTLNFREDPNAPGGYSIDRSMGYTALAEHPAFRRLLGEITPRAERYLFPELNPSRSPESEFLGR